MLLFGRQTNLTAIVNALTYALTATWLNLPVHLLKDPALQRQQVDEEHVAETVTILWNTGFPMHYHTYEVMGNGKLRLYSLSYVTFNFNLALCILGVAVVYIWLSASQISISSLLLLIAASAVLFWADKRFPNLTYFYTIPTIFFLPILFLVLRKIKDRVLRKRVAVHGG